MSPLGRDLMFWLAVALVSIASSVLLKIVAARAPWPALQEFAAAS